VNSEMKIDVQDVIEVLTNQRNAALDEIVRQGAMVRKLMKENEQLKRENDIVPDGGAELERARSSELSGRLPS
jgi:hypothetical protein